MRAPRTLATKLVLIGSAFLILALGSIGLTLWVSWQLEGGAAAVNEAGRMRMQTWQLTATLAAMPADGDPAVVATMMQRFDDSLALLRDGDPSRPLFVPWNDASRAQFDQITGHWSRLRSDWAAGRSLGHLPAEAGAFVDRIDGFVGAIEGELSRSTSVLNLFQLAMMGLAIGSAVVMLYAGHFFVVDPLDRLRSGIHRLQGGDLGTRVAVRSDDEFGVLASGFNRMAETLQGLYRTLEDKVREKTARLAQQNERLSTLYEASRALGEATELKAMAQDFVRRLRQAAHADAAAIRWSDEANQRYVLLADDCLPEAMTAGEHCLQPGDCHCGPTPQSARLRVITIHGEMPLQHCARAGFDTLVSVPLLWQGRLLGEIDLFYRQPVALGDEERSLLDALASHLAGAMEGLRAQALDRASAVAEERSLLARELHDSIAQSLAFLKIQVGLLRGALHRGDAAAVALALEEVDTGVRESTADVRELLLHFRTRTDAEDIVPALRTTLHKFELQTGLSAQMDVHGQGLPLAPDEQVQVLHVVQEALSNVRKHAGASGVWLTLHQGPQWRLEVRDDGHGFDAEGPGPDDTHVGLRIMRERATGIGAAVQVRTSPGQGTCVTLSRSAVETTVTA